MKAEAFQGMVDQGESWSLQNFRRFEVQRCTPPDELHQFNNDVRQAKGDQKLRDMPKLVYLAQTQALKQGPQPTDNDGRQNKRWPKTCEPCNAVPHIRAQHVKRSMRKVKHTHHAENQGQP